MSEGVQRMMGRNVRQLRIWAMISETGRSPCHHAIGRSWCWPWVGAESNTILQTEYGVLDGASEGQRLYDDLRKRLLDLSRRNPMLNYKHRVGSRRQLRIVHTNLESTFAELTTKQRELPFAPLPEPDDIPEDELTDSFKAALGYAKSTDLC